jgi:hypothetical protein
MITYYVMCANFYATYKAGVFCANSRNEAIKQAQQRHKTVFPTGEFRWWVTDKDSYEED